MGLYAIPVGPMGLRQLLSRFLAGHDFRVLPWTAEVASFHLLAAHDYGKRRGWEMTVEDLRDVRVCYSRGEARDSRWLRIARVLS